MYKAVDGAARELFAESAPAYPGHADREARAWTLRAFLLELVAPPVPERYPRFTPAEFAAHIRAETATWARIIRARGIKAE